MEKTVGNLAKYMKELLPQRIPETLEIQSFIDKELGEVATVSGIVAFNDFLIRLFDYIANDTTISEIPIKGKEKFSDETTLSVEFPFLNHIKSIFVNIGQHGTLSEKGNTMVIAGWEVLSRKYSLNKHSTTKISTPQMMKTLRFLSTCGLVFEGIDLSEKKPDVMRIKNIRIYYPENPAMLVGWKTLGLAQSEYSTRKNDDILLRCDYSMLNNNQEDSTDLVREYAGRLSPIIQHFVQDFHQYYLDLGMTCTVELGFLCTHIIYSYKRKPLWRFSGSFHNGHRLILKTKQMDKYIDTIQTFSDPLKKKILKGYGCDRKKGTGHGNCQKGCEGFSFSLDDGILNISHELKTWQSCELQNM